MWKNLKRLVTFDPLEKSWLNNGELNLQVALFNLVSGRSDVDNDYCIIFKDSGPQNGWAILSLDTINSVSQIPSISMCKSAYGFGKSSFICYVETDNDRVIVLERNVPDFFDEELREKFPIGVEDPALNDANNLVRKRLKSEWGTHFWSDLSQSYEPICKTVSDWEESIKRDFDRLISLSEMDRLLDLQQQFIKNYNHEHAKDD